MKNIKKRYYINSGQIRKITYNRELKILLITFHNGSRYSYENVDNLTASRLLNIQYVKIHFESSIGKAFNYLVKGQFNCNKIDKNDIELFNATNRQNIEQIAPNYDISKILLDNLV